MTTPHTPSDRELLITAREYLWEALAIMDGTKTFNHDNILTIKSRSQRATAALLELERRMAGVKPPAVGDEPIQQQADRP